MGNKILLTNADVSAMGNWGTFPPHTQHICIEICLFVCFDYFKLLVCIYHTTDKKSYMVMCEFVPQFPNRS